MIDAAEDSVAELAVAGKGDAPITSLAEDRLGRVAFAKALAAEVLVAPVTSGYVMGLTGPWGSGKTSILNMTVDALDGDALVVQFNPWMFSGTEALVSSFFDEIGKQLGGADSRLKGLADKLSLYGHLLSPLASFVGAGNAVSAAADVMQQLASRPSIQQQRAELREQLAKLDRRLVVVVDDVDRLRPEEILDVIGDLESVTEWSEPQQSAEVLEKDKDGRPLKVKMKVKAAGITDEQVVAYTWSDNKVSWTLVSSGQQRSQDASYTLTPDGDKTKVTFEISVDPVVPLPGFVLKRAVKGTIDTGTKGLRDRVLKLKKGK